MDRIGQNQRRRVSFVEFASGSRRRQTSPRCRRQTDIQTRWSPTYQGRRQLYTATSLPVPPSGELDETWRRLWFWPTKPELNRYRIVVREGPSHGHRWHVQKNWWNLDMCICGFRDMQADRHIDRHTDRGLILMFLSSVEEHIFLPKTNQNAGFWPKVTGGARSGPSRRERPLLPYPSAPPLSHPMFFDPEYFQLSVTTEQLICYFTENKYVKCVELLSLCIRIRSNTIAYCQVITWNWCFSAKNRQLNAYNL